MKIRSYKFPGYLFLLLIAVSIIGCKKLVEVGTPTNLLATTSVFSNDNTAIATQLAVYAQMQSFPWTLAQETAMSSDEFTSYAPDEFSIHLYSNELNANTDAGSLPWSFAYNMIYQENAIIENANASGRITSHTKKLLVGEAEFTRAYYYFYLVNLYGDVPLITTTDYKANAQKPRAPKASVYQQMIQDLTDAQQSLSSTYLDATDTTVTSDRVRPTTWAASALLARVYLYNGKYDSAEIEATNVINNSSLFGLPSLDSVFFANSIEAIWQIIPPSTQLYTYEGNSFILGASPGGNGASNANAISPELLNTFDSGDNRKTQWIGVYADGLGNNWYFPYKYKDNAAATTLQEYSMVLRLGEQYLIRAEARAQQNKLTDAISDIDMIRARAGLAGLPNTLAQPQILAAVAHERQVELFSEGHRWLDLKRTNTVDAVMSSVTPLKVSGSWDTRQQLYPLSSTDIQTGVNLVQNPGY
jgi:hypothetical protein